MTSRNLLFLSVFAFLALSQDYTNQGSDWTAPCASSNTQSPLDFTLVRYNDRNLQLLNFHLKDWTGTLTVQNALVYMNKPSDTSTQVEVQYKGSKCLYNAERFEFHAPSQHKLNTQVKDLQMELIFKRIDDSCTSHPTYIGVSVLFDATTNTADSFLSGIGIPSPGSGTAALQTLIESLYTNGFNTYPGSLTSDTCAEVTYWAVARTVKPMSTDQRSYFNSKWKDNSGFAGGNGNNRIVQESNQRDDYTIDESRVVFNQEITSGGIMSAVVSSSMILLLGVLLIL